MLLTPAQILDSAVLGSAVASVCLFAIQPGQIFGWYWQLLDKLAQTQYAALAKPLGYCEVCTAGQVSLWFFAWSEKNLPVACLMCALAMIAAKAVARLLN